MASNAEIIAMLNDDMRDEHGAVILYLKHAYFLGEEGGEACEIEQTARDEMRHFQWLAQAIVQLGGTPTLERTEFDLGGDLPSEWMQQDIRAEEGAIAKYERHHAAIDDPKIKALLERILTDERAHLDVFTDFRDQFAEAGREPEAYPAGESQVPQPVGEVLDYAAKHEYTVILQYLFHSFMTSNNEASREFVTIAINEMQHFGWFAEFAAEEGHMPYFDFGDVDTSRRTPGMLQADLDVEKQVSEAYARAAAEFGGQAELEELTGLLERARQNEDFHAHMFGMMLGRVTEGQPPHQRPGIGPTQPQSEGEARPPAAPAADEPQTKSGRQFTVGSLIKGNK